jgi:hypothetical protein
VKKIPVFQSLLFMIGLLVGVRASLSASLPPLAEKTAQAFTTETRRLAIFPNEQRSILVVVVDELEAEQPALRNIWMLLYMPGNPRLTLMPVFPSLAEPKYPYDQDLYRAFKILRSKGASKIDEPFMELLLKKGIFWSGYILVDEPGLEQIASSLSSSNNLYDLGRRANSFKRSNALVSESYLAGDADHLPLLRAQGQFYQELCWEAFRQNKKETGLPQSLMQLIPQHLDLDFDLRDLGSEFDLLRQHGSTIVCEIPALELSITAKP